MELARMPQFPRSPARPRPAQTVFDARLDRVQSKLLHAAELIADKYVEQYSAPANEPEPVEVRRRAIANGLQSGRRGPGRSCAHAQACRGEPAHCLDACLPALPPGTLAAYIMESRRRRKR